MSTRTSTSGLDGAFEDRGLIKRRRLVQTTYDYRVFNACNRLVRYNCRNPLREHSPQGLRGAQFGKRYPALTGQPFFQRADAIKTAG